MAGAGTGQPGIFACAKCRKEWSRIRLERRYGWAPKEPGLINRIELTGKIRKVPPGIGGYRVVFTRYQYRCLDCGHVGWSRHVEVARLADKKGIAPHPDDPRVRRGTAR